MPLPPSKRLRADLGSAAPDPFDDDLDFTQEDLEQMDILASQAGEGEEPRASRMTFALGDAGTRNSTRVTADEDQNYRQLEEQQAHLKRRLKEVEEEILMRNGEIRVLRDSLKLANQEQEQQRLAQRALEAERERAQGEREREMARKVQSLQSELHFKEAEINQMRGKIQAERGGKQPANTHTVVSPVSRGFMTKELFSAQFSKKTSPLQKGPLLADEKPAERFITGEPDTSRTSDHQQEGCVLLNLLLQPLDPSTLGLCHLLSISPAALPIVLSQSSFISPGSLASSTESRWLPHAQAGFQQLQSLAMSALSALALTPSSGVPPLLSCPSAGHLLPLLGFHISCFCQSLESVGLSAKASLHGSGSSELSLGSGLEESLSGQEEFALAAMTALYHTLGHSREALGAVLGPPDAEIRPPGVKNLLSGDPPLLSRLLQLADPAFLTAAVQREELLHSSLRTLSRLAENAQENQLYRLQVVMTSGVLCRCLTPEASFRTARLSVRLLTLLIYNEEMAAKLCSHQCPCPFLKIFQYITSRPDKSPSGDAWSRFELELIRFLTKLFTLKAETWAAFCGSACQCVNEVVRTVIVVLHRQWLDTKGRGHPALRTPGGPGLQALREALLLLHWLMLRDSAFSEHCLDVLHLYDQAIPAIRDTLRLIPDLSESEELALEEICRSEAEDVEDVEMETGS